MIHKSKLWEWEVTLILITVGCVTCGCDGVVPVEHPGRHGGGRPQEDQADEQPGPGHGAPLLGHRGVAHVDVPLHCQG